MSSQNFRYRIYKNESGQISPINDKSYYDLNEAMSDVRHLHFSPTQGIIERVYNKSGIRVQVFHTEPYVEFEPNPRDPDYIRLHGKSLELGSIYIHNSDIPIYLEQVTTEYNYSTRKFDKRTTNALRLNIYRDIDHYIGKRHSINDLRYWSSHTKRDRSFEVTSNIFRVVKIYHDGVTLETRKLTGGHRSHSTKDLRTVYQEIGVKVKKYKIKKSVNPILFM